MHQLISKNFFIIALSFFVSGCTLFEQRPDSAEIIERASQQKIFFVNYDVVWKAAHSALKYTIASENQDYGTIETDYIKSVDGWLAPNETKPQFKSSRYKLILTFARGETNGRESTRVTIEKRIEVFRDFISETKIVPSDGLEEQSIFYRIEREIIIANAIKKLGNVIQ